MNNEIYNPTLQVVIPQEQEEQIYMIYLGLASKAVEQATKNVTVNNRYLNKSQLCKYFKCAPKVIDAWIADGLPVFTKGRDIMIDMNDVHEYIQKIKQ